MRFRTAAIFISSLVFGTLPAVAAGPNMKEGLWEITITVNMSTGTGLPHTIQQCFKRQDIENLRGVPGPARIDRQCQVSNYKIRGNTASWKMACQGDMTTTGEGLITYKGTSYSGKTTMAVEYGGRTQNMATNYAGKYIGNCKK
jgi:hypothetical protein